MESMINHNNYKNKEGVSAVPKEIDPNEYKNDIEQLNKEEKIKKKKYTNNYSGVYADCYIDCCDFCTRISPCEETCYNLIKLLFLYLFIIPLLLHVALVFIYGMKKIQAKRYLFILSIPIQCTLFICYEIPLSLIALLETLISFIFPPLMQYTPLRLYK